MQHEAGMRYKTQMYEKFAYRRDGDEVSGS